MSGQGVEVVPRDHLGHLVPVGREGGPEVGGHGEMTGLAIPARHGLIGNLAQQVLGEAEVTALGGQAIGADGEHLAAEQLGQPGPHRLLRLDGHGHQGIGGEG